MNKQLNEVTENLKAFDIKSLKKLLFNYLLGILIFSYFSPTIEYYLAKLAVDDSVYNSRLKVFVLLTFLLLVIYVATQVCKLFYQKYRFSKITLHTLSVSFLGYLFFRILSPPVKFEFIELWDKSPILYIDIIGLLFVITLATQIGLVFYFSGKKSKPAGPLLADDPIEDIKDDKFNFEKQATQLFELIKNSNFENSFSIGIVASWGSGKSSFINILKEKVNSKERREILSFEFLPYMSPQEDDIYIGFFNQLINELKPYSGELSNELINYADALLENYHKPSLKNLFSKHSTDLSAKSSLSLFNSINDTLKTLDKKIIVFIDELDRLSAEEIMQVLKLIRTSANFRNFVFCVAIDKEYVLKSLLSDNKIYEHSYIDKFFQLEIYLPQLNINDLKDDFVLLLEENNRFEISFIIEIKAALLDTFSRFDDYVITYRDLKRLVNQLLLDKTLYPIKLQAVDMLNFTLLKMKYPSVVGILKHHKDKVLRTTKDGYYQLRIDSKPNLESELVIYFLLNERDHAIKYSKLEKEIIINTLLSIFKTKEERVNIDVYYSLQFWTNLRSVLEMKSDSKLIDFMSMFDLSYNELSKKLSSEEDFEVLNYASYYPFLDKEKLKEHISFLINLYCLSSSGKKYETRIIVIGLSTRQKF